MATERADVRFVREPDGPGARCVITVTDPELFGRSATLRIRRKTDVHDSRPVNATETLLTREIPSLQAHNDLALGSSLEAYTYRGEHLDIEIHSELEIDDGILFDTKIREEEVITLGQRPAVSNDAKELIEPADGFDLLTNLEAIPPKNRLITVVLVLAAMILVTFNTWVGWHDEFSADAAVWFYDHVDSDGDSESPLYKSLTASGVLGAALWMAIKRQLRTYMTFELCNLPVRIDRGASIEVSRLLRGQSRVLLDNVRLRIVACNMERGEYKRGSGTNERTVSFSEPVRAVLLYDRVIESIPPGVPVQSRLEGEVRFEPMFRALYPPQMVSRSHGVAVYWEVQLIHDELVDQELVGPVDCFPWSEFLE